MIVWGGANGTTLNDGARYNPATNTWTPVSSVFPPSDRTNHTTVWDGARMIVWGGSGSSTGVLNSGGVYDPLPDRWAPTPIDNAPAARSLHAAVWAKDRMIVWGGTNPAATAPFGNGARYTASDEENPDFSDDSFLRPEDTGEDSDKETSICGGGRRSGSWIGIWTIPGILLAIVFGIGLRRRTVR